MTASTLAEQREVTAWDREAVADFDRGGEDILVVERPPLAGIADAVASALVHDYRSLVTAKNTDARVAEAMAELNLDCPPLAADIAAMARSVLAQFGATEASLRVEVVNQTSCPKFHCDNVRVRLVTTYHGPATEYVRADARDEVRSAPAFALVFLKGHQHPNHADSVHHRSPAVPASGKRLCVVLDC